MEGEIDQVKLAVDTYSSDLDVTHEETTILLIGGGGGGGEALEKTNYFFHFSYA